TVGVVAAGLTKDTELQLVSVTSSNASGAMPNGDGRSSFGVLVLNSSGGVTLRGNTISAGNGASGAKGADGAVGAHGGKGGDGSGATHGGQGQSSCGALGGNGADGVSGL